MTQVVLLVFKGCWRAIIATHTGRHARFGVRNDSCHDCLCMTRSWCWAAKERCWCNEPSTACAHLFDVCWAPCRYWNTCPKQMHNTSSCLRLRQMCCPSYLQAPAAVMEPQRQQTSYTASWSSWACCGVRWGCILTVCAWNATCKLLTGWKRHNTITS